MRFVAACRYAPGLWTYKKWILQTILTLGTALTSPYKIRAPLTTAKLAKVISFFMIFFRCTLSWGQVLMGVYLEAERIHSGWQRRNVLFSFRMWLLKELHASSVRSCKSGTPIETCPQLNVHRQNIMKNEIVLANFDVVNGALFLKGLGYYTPNRL